MNARWSAGSVTAVAAAMVLCLAGCTPANDYTDLDSARQANDIVPTVAASGMNRSSIRYVGTVDGTGLYLGRSTHGEICLILIEPSTGWSGSCSQSHLEVQTRTQSFAVVTTGSPDRAGWERLGANILVKK